LKFTTVQRWSSINPLAGILFISTSRSTASTRRCGSTSINPLAGILFISTHCSFRRDRIYWKRYQSPRGDSFHFYEEVVAYFVRINLAYQSPRGDSFHFYSLG